MEVGRIEQLTTPSNKLIDAMVNDRYLEKLNSLPNPSKQSDWKFPVILTGHLLLPGYNCSSALDNIPPKYWAEIGRAIRDNDIEAVGRLIIAGVTDALRIEAEWEIEDEIGGEL